jgi:hypothetical protein
MENQKAKPGRWLYAVAALILVLGCLIAVAVVTHRLPGLPGAPESRVNLDKLTHVIVPGSEEITFEKSGAHAVYYEYRSVVDGIVYNSSEKPPALTCTLTSRATGADVAVVPDYVPTNRYSAENGERVGVLIRSLTIPEPGAYNLTCQYPGGSLEPEIALAVGPNLVWEFFGVAAEILSTAATGLAVLLGSGAAAACVAVIVSRKRRQSHKAAAGG